MAGVLGAAYYYVGTIPPQPFYQPTVYADMNMRAEIGNNIWWHVDYFNFQYFKFIYVFNNNTKPMKLDIFWEAFPTEMTPNCTWSVTAPDMINASSIVEVRLFLSVAENRFKGISSYQGDVLTQIGGETR